jgi:hypothetical protein
VAGEVKKDKLEFLKLRNILGQVKRTESIQLEASKYSLLPAGSAFMDFLPGVQPAGQTEVNK